MVNRHEKRKGIGLYTYEQAKNTTAFDYFAQVVVGTIVAALGGFILGHEIAVRSEQIRKYGSAETNVWGWITGLAMVVIGLFMAHAGVIFWTRRMLKRLSSVMESHKLTRRRYRDGRP